VEWSLKESKDVDESVVSEYKPKLLEFISPFEPKSIYNADETGLVLGHYQQNQLWLREKSVPGTKCPKKDLQCHYKANGGRNGKAAKPRCFKNREINNLPVIWRNNKKAWMTAATMEEWKYMFNAKTRKKIEMQSFFLTMLPATQR
jgi:hypothetical protein